MKYVVITVLFFLLVPGIQSQSLKGVITDENNQPVPFATIYIEEIQSGTASNSNGEYDIKIKPGKYSVLYKSLGFKPVKMEAEITSSGKTLNIILPSEVYNIKEVTISSKGEDPAYAIMRKAIALAPFHLREVKYYESLVYLRGTIYIDKMPKLFSKHIALGDGGQKIHMKTGDVYTEESLMEITFNAPSFYKRKVRSLRTSLPGASSNPLNPVVIIEASFYESEIMDMVSPLAPQAFQHYKFKYDGFAEENGQVINKIRVIPRRKSQDLFDGYIYIVDKKWCLHSIDLMVTQFWGNVLVRGMFGKVDQGAWLPVSYSFNVTASYLGVKGRYRYTSSVKYTKTQMNDNLSQHIKTSPQRANAAGGTKAEEKIKQALTKAELTNRDMRKVSKNIGEVSAQQRKEALSDAQINEMKSREVDTLAKKRDTAYWNEFRPVPLTAEEIKSFEEGPEKVIQKVKRDSLNLSKDTSSVKRKKKNPAWIATGKTFNGRDGKVNFRYRGLIQPILFSYNTVDGFSYGLKSDVSIKLKSDKRVDVKPWIGYAFNRKALMWELKTDYLYAPAPDKKGTFSLNIGNQTLDFNRDKGVHPFINTIYSLLLRENYKKLYNSKYAEIANSIGIKGRFRLSSSLKYEIINELPNNSNFSFFYQNSKSYSSNIPENANYLPLGDNNFRNFVFSTALTVNLSSKPKSDGYNRQHNHYPSFTVKYTTGIPDVFSSISNFHLLELTANKRYWLGRNRVFKYQFNSAYWISSKNAHFSDFTCLATSKLPFTFTPFDNTYQLLPYYTGNTNQWSVGAHAQYQTKLLLLKRLPLISNRIWTENLYVSYLHNPNFKHYVELGYGLGQLWAIGEFAVFTSFENFSYRSIGAKLSIAVD